MSPPSKFAIVILLAACSQGGAMISDLRPEAETGLLGQAGQELLAMYPGIRVHIDHGQVRLFYGMPMTPGATAEEAAQGWLQAHATAFGAGQLELEEIWATPVMQGRFTAFGYRQYLQGIPVEYGGVRILVLNDPVPRVVYAAATVAQPPDAAQARMNLDGETAVAIVQASAAFRHLPDWTQPELAIYQGDGQWQDAAAVWKFVGQNDHPSAPQSMTFFVDIATGQLVHVRSEIYHNEITGSVKGRASPGTLPDAPYNPPTLKDLPEMRVRIDGGPSAFTSRQGIFSIQNAGTSLVNVGTGPSASLGYGGRWVNISPTAGVPVLQQLPLTPPGQAHFSLNPAPTELLTSQLNVFIGTTLAHNYFKDRAPSFTKLDTAIVANVNINANCNAFFHGNEITINFFTSGGGCPNTGYSSIIAHEYGHFIVNRLERPQGGFGEGYSDVIAMLLYDDHVIARGFYGFGSVLRDPIAANVQYPCPGSGTGSGIHHCGQILGGAWWRMRQNFGSYMGSAAGLEHVRDLHVAWSLITNGGTGSHSRNSAHPITAIEVLVLDDDDGNLSNGTPNWERICPAFAAHGIDCPPLTLIELAAPNGVPDQIMPGKVTEIAVEVVPVTGSGQPNTGRLFYRSPGASKFISEPMIQSAPNLYTAELPVLACGEFIEFYFAADPIGGDTVFYPPTAPAELLTSRAVAGTVEIIAADYDFETDQGWTVWNHPSLTGGHWEWVIPRASFYGSQPVQTGSAFRGQRCFVTENGDVSASVNSHDVDGGPTMLTSPRIDISGADLADLTFAYWHFTLNGTPDDLEVDVSSDNGVNWVRAATYKNSNGWQTARIELLDLIAPTADLRVRFSVSDYPNDSLTETALDDVRITTWRCQSNCYANCDSSTVQPILNVDDFTCFINRFSSAQALPHEQQVTAYANCDGSTVAPVLNVDDFTCFISAFAQGCP